MDLLQLLGMPTPGAPAGGGGIGMRMPMIMVYDTDLQPSNAGRPGGPASEDSGRAATVPGSHAARNAAEQNTQRQNNLQRQAHLRGPEQFMQQQLLQQRFMQQQAMQDQPHRGDAAGVASATDASDAPAIEQRLERRRQPGMQPPFPAMIEGADGLMRYRQDPGMSPQGLAGPGVPPIFAAHSSPRTMLNAFEEQLLMAQIIRHIQASSANEPPPSQVGLRAENSVVSSYSGGCAEMLKS
eukprot:SAG31_NODE_3613_length_4067_cov_1.304183_3_plen_240_part_00